MGSSTCCSNRVYSDLRSRQRKVRLRGVNKISGTFLEKQDRDHKRILSESKVYGSEIAERAIKQSIEEIQFETPPC